MCATGTVDQDFDGTAVDRLFRQHCRIDFKGRLSKADYDTVLLPAVMNALKTADFTRIDAGAVGEDIKVGIEHSMRWDRTAVVTEVKWLRHTIKFFSFLMPGEMKMFSLGQVREWIAQD